MTHEGIRKVLRDYVDGPHRPGERRKVTHADVEEILRQARSKRPIPGTTRAALIQVLTQLDARPDSFEVPDDKTELMLAAIEDIETAAAFSRQSPLDQRDFLHLGILLGGGDGLGFTRLRAPMWQLPAEVQASIQLLVEDEYLAAGEGRFLPARTIACTIIERRRGVYGYTADFSFPSRDGSGDWYGSLLLSERGARLRRDGRFEPRQGES